MKNKLVVPALSAVIGAGVVGAIWGINSTVNYNENVVAQVGNTSITHSDIQHVAEQATGSQVLTQLITNQLVTDAAKAANITASTTDVNNDLMSLEQQNQITSDAQLAQALATSHMTKADLLAQLKIQVLEEKLAQNKIKVTDSQISAYYNANQKSFATPATVSLSDIVVAKADQAQTVLSLLKTGHSFPQVAKDYSIDSNTKSKAGLLGTFTKDQLDPSIATVAFHLKTGEFSAPIKVSGGYEILYCNGSQEAKVPTLDKVKGTIKTMLQQKSMESPQQLVAELATAAKIKISDTSYSSIVDQLENPTPTSPMGSGGQ